jgi:SAM-dependent methyltransferase
MSDTQPQFSYDDIGDAYAAGVDSAPYNAHYERPATLALIPDVRDAHILDAGCGSGFYTEQLALRGARVTAMDGSAVMVGHARERLTRAGLISADEGNVVRVSLQAADLNQPLDFLEADSVDGILSALVMHYLEDWGETLKEFRRVLRPQGWLVMSTHHPAADAARFNVPNYFATELIEDYWDWVGTVRFYRRPLTAIVTALSDARFVIERLIEPQPTEWFRDKKPEAFERLLRQPEFLLIRARMAD